MLPGPSGNEDDLLKPSDKHCRSCVALLGFSVPGDHPRMDTHGPQPLPPPPSPHFWGGESKIASFTPQNDLQLAPLMPIFQLLPILGTFTWPVRVLLL